MKFEIRGFLKICRGNSSFNKQITGILHEDVYTFMIIPHSFQGPRSSVTIATELRVGRPGDRIPVGARISARPYRPWGPPSLLYNWYRVFPGGKVRPGRDADNSPNPLLAPRSWKSRAIPLLPSGPQPGL